MIAIIITTKLLLVLVLADLAGHQKQTECPADPENFEKADPQKVGVDVILPCVARFNINVEKDNLEWSKGNDEIYIIRRKPAEKYKDRAHVSIDELKRRNASLKLFNVNDADEGQYCCCIVTDNDRKCIDVTLVLENLTEDGKKNKSLSSNDNSTTPPKKNGNDNSTDAKSPSSGTIIAVVVGLVILALLIAFILLIWKRKQNRDGHNRSNTDNTQEQVPLNTTNNTNNMGNPENTNHMENVDNKENVDNAVNAENANKSGQH